MPLTEKQSDVLCRMVLFCVSLVPFLRLIYLGTHDGLGANPQEFIIRSTGTWALVFLCLSLTMTPLKRVSGWRQWMKLRRQLGLFCFFYACLHSLVWFWLDQGLDWRAAWQDVLNRPFILSGFSAFILLIPLAITSTQGMIRRLGKHWGTLHRCVYLIALAVIMHYWLHKAGKNDFATVKLYAAIIASLLGMRLWWAWRR